MADPLLEAFQRQYDAQRGAAPAPNDAPVLRSSLPVGNADNSALEAFQRQYDAQRQAALTDRPQPSKVNGDQIVTESALPLGQPTTTFLQNGLNTAFFNVPRNIWAALDHYVDGKGANFTEAYDRRKAMDESLDRNNPNSALAGTAAGIVGPVAATFMTGGAAAPALAPVVPKMVGGVARKPGLLSVAGDYAGTLAKGAGYGAAGGAAAELFDSKDLRKTVDAGVIGGAVGGVAAPAFKAVGSTAARLTNKKGDTIPGLNGDKAQETLDVLKGLPPGVVSPEAIKSLEKLVQDMTPTAHPDTVAFANLLRGLSKDDTVRFLSGIGGFGLGGPVGAGVGYVVPRAMNTAADALERRSKDFYAKDWALPYQVTQRPALRAGLLAGGWAGDESR